MGTAKWQQKNGNRMVETRHYSARIGRLKKSEGVVFMVLVVLVVMMILMITFHCTV